MSVLSVVGIFVVVQIAALAIIYPCLVIAHRSDAELEALSRKSQEENKE